MPVNAANREVYTFGAPAASASADKKDVVKLFMEGSHGSIIEAKYTNMARDEGTGSVNLTVEIQHSDDNGVTDAYATLANSAKVVVPGGVAAIVGNVKKYFKVVATGPTEGQVEISVEKTTNLIRI